MEIIDLSHTINATMPLYPGTDPVEIIQNATVDEHGYNEKKLILTSHIGTHIDAPAHMLRHGERLDEMPLDSFYGNAEIVDVQDRHIDIEFLEQYESVFENNDYVIFYTGHERFWHQKKYFEKYPVLSPEAAEWVSGKKLKGIGFDVCSADPVGSNDLPVHHILFDAGFLIVENLTNLKNLLGTRFLFSCFPLKISDADGSPVRAVAIIS